MEMTLAVPFPTPREAEIAYNSLMVDPEPARSLVTKHLVVNGPNLTARFTASNARGLRVSVNSFLEHLVLVTDTIDQFGPPAPAARE